MQMPRFQFSMRGLLLATLWFSVCFGCFAMIDHIHRQRISTPWENWLTHLMMIAPFVAVGALFGRALVGLAVGIAALTTFWTIFYLT
jgi:hypothetical protein